MQQQDSSVISMKFPRKLWKIVNECDTGAIRWSKSGLTILLHYKRFQEEYLDAPDSIFKTSNITSFIRQLNLYGFRKVTSHNRDPICNAYNPDVHEFLHENFRATRLDLLSRVSRKTSGRKSRNSLPRNSPRPPDHPELPPASPHPMSRLRMCQLALTETLEQIIENSRREKYGRNVNIENEENFPSAAEIFGANFLVNNEFSNWLDAQVVSVEGNNSKGCRPWYDSVLRKYVDCTCSQNIL